MSQTLAAPSSGQVRVSKRTFWSRIVAARYLFLMFLPGFVLILIFNYGSMYGVQIAFKDFRILDGIWKSPWVGLKHFKAFFTHPVAMRVLWNTIRISVLKIIFGFPAPIILALLLNELRDGPFKRIVQSASYLPHFISWIVVASLVSAMLSPSSGPINMVLKTLGMRPIYFMVDKAWFTPVLVASDIWKGAGWGAIIYLAALSGVDPSLHEAAIVDGASRWQRITRINLPLILPIVSIVLILRMGSILNAGFDQVFNMYNPTVYEVADIIDTFVYRRGLISMDFSFASAVGLFKSVVGLTLVLAVNAVTRRLSDGESALW